MEIFRSAETLKSNVFNYLKDTEIMNGVPRELFTGVPMEQYLYEMSLKGKYGDEITFRAIANIFNVEVVIILTSGEHIATTQCSIRKKFVRLFCRRSRQTLCFS